LEARVHLEDNSLFVCLVHHHEHDVEDDVSTLVDQMGEPIGWGLP
jgi:hypothetical protein